MRTNRSIKDVLGGPIGSITDALKQYKKYENKWKNELKALKNQNKMLYIIANKSGSLREIKNIRAKSSKKTGNSSGDDLESDSLLARDSS